MKISCPSCSAKYSIADDKVQNRLAKIRCRKCGTSIVIDGTQSPPNVYAATDAAETAPAPPVQQGSPGTLFSVDFGEGDQRQLTVSQLVDAYNSGQVNAETYLWTEGYADWTPLGQVDEVVGAIHKGASVLDSNAAAAMSTAPFEDPFPQPPQRSGADLFGGISTAGSERDFATSSTAPSPAAARAFGTPNASSGARNESSVLFSLSALTSGSSSSRPSVPAPSAPNNDDSGLIDLKALTAAAAAQARPMPHHVAHSGAVAPAPFAPPVAAPFASPLGVPGTRGASVPPAKKGNTGLYIIGASIVVAVAAAAAVITLINKEPPPPPVLTQVAPAPAPAPAPAALPEQPDTASLPASDEPKLPSDSNETGTKTTTTTAKKPASKPSSSSSAASKPSSSPSTSSSSPPSSSSSKPAASKPSKCNCKSGDLMCAMRCSSK